jgi:hypothetical protein
MSERDEIKERAEQEAAKPENEAARDQNQRQGADDSHPADSPSTDA